MTTPRRHHIDRATAEQLLTGGPGRHAVADPGLVDLLAAAAAPPRPSELAGEDAALLAFRRAKHDPAPSPRRPRMFQLALAKLATVKLVLAVTSAAGVGGVALAASTGSLPDPVQDAAHSAFGAPEARAKVKVKVTDKEAKAEAKADAKADAKANKDRADTADRGSPSPSFVGLCKAWVKNPKTGSGKSAQSSAYSALLRAAGGPAKVTVYCKALLEAAASGTGKNELGKRIPGKADDARGHKKSKPGLPDLTPNQPGKSKAKQDR